jgi:hypothetical protein
MQTEIERAGGLISLLVVLCAINHSSLACAAESSALVAVRAVYTALTDDQVIK